MNISQLETPTEESQLNPFYISFSDLMVLLCVFFVMILGMSKIDTGSFEKLRTGFTGSAEGTLVELASKLKELAKNQQGVKVEMAEDGVRLDLESAVLFDTGSSVLKSEKLLNLTSILYEILGTDYQIDIEGHTDDVPFFRRVKNEIDTNWSLSGRRAASVVHHLKNFGFPNSRLRIVGFASTKPKVPVAGRSGRSLKRARAQNRRVSLLVK